MALEPLFERQLAQTERCKEEAGEVYERFWSQMLWVRYGSFVAAVVVDCGGGEGKKRGGRESDGVMCA